MYGEEENAYSLQETDCVEEDRTKMVLKEI
jgi:hypothetical protein